MSVDLHPEDLLDRSRANSGVVSDHLSDHLTHCPACTIEQAAHRAMDEELGWAATGAGRVLEEDAGGHLDRLVCGALIEAGWSISALDDSELADDNDPQLHALAFQLLGDLSLDEGGFDLLEEGESEELDSTGVTGRPDGLDGLTLDRLTAAALASVAAENFGPVEEDGPGAQIYQIDAGALRASLGGNEDIRPGKASHEDDPRNNGYTPLAAHLSSEETGEEQTSEAPAVGERRFGLGRLWVLASAATLVISVGAAGFWVAEKISRQSAETSEISETEPVVRLRRAHPVAPEPEPEPEAVEEELAEPLEPTALEGEAPAIEAPRSRARRPRASAGENFAEANSARRARRYPDAIRLYRRLQATHRGAPEEILSRALLGRLMLDRHRDRSALRLFDSYLAARPRGPLAAEARAGRATALGRRGRRGAERTAWERVLREFPNSAYASRARRRLEQLDGQPTP